MFFPLRVLAGWVRTLKGKFHLSSFFKPPLKNVLGGIWKDGPYGGTGGYEWTDAGLSHLHGRISGVEVHAGREVDSIRVRYGNVWGPKHGGAGGSRHFLDVNPGARITAVKGRSGLRVDQLELVTSDGVVLGPLGGGGGHPFTAASERCFLSYISGRSGKLLDSIALHWDCS